MTIICNANQPDPSGAMPQDLSKLIEFAVAEGANTAAVVSAADISVKDNLAALCTTCPTYGLSPSCPPHGPGPAEFRRLQTQFPRAVVIHLVVPLSALLSSQRIEVTRFLHELTSRIEAYAVALGYTDSRAFACGSCKSIFCEGAPDCRRLSGGVCRHPEQARPSMSGFGIDVPELVEKCGWPSGLIGTRASGESMSWLAGLVLIG